MGAFVKFLKNNMHRNFHYEKMALICFFQPHMNYILLVYYKIQTGYILAYSCNVKINKVIIHKKSQLLYLSVIF